MGKHLTALFEELGFPRPEGRPVPLADLLPDRRNDIALLARHFLELNTQKLSRDTITFSDAAMSILLNYRWPGNVRQLQNAVQFALIKCRGSVIEPHHLPLELAGSAGLSEQEPKSPGKAGRKPKLTADAVEQAMVKTGGNKAKAARYLGVGRATLYNFLSDHGEIAEKATA